MRCLVCGGEVEVPEESICEPCLDRLVARTRAAPLDDRPPPQFWACFSLFYADDDGRTSRNLGDC